MRKFLTCLLLLGSAPLAAQEAVSAPEATAEDAVETAAEQVFLTEAPETIDELTWLKRIVAVFADSPNDPNFRRQMDALAADPEALAFRDVVVLTDMDPAANSTLRQTFRPRGFMMVLVGKDGQIKLRKPLPWDVREISRAIDKTPLRQQELRDLGQRGAVPVER
jgi:hypothetical protein